MRITPTKLIMAGALLLTALGLWWMPGASPHIARYYFGDPAHFADRHRLWVAVGLLAFVGMIAPRERFMRRFIPWTVVPTFLAVLLTRSTSLGWTAGGAARWIRVGSLTIAPKDFLAPALVGLTGWLAGWASKKRGWQRAVKYVAAGYFGLAALLAVLEPDLSHAVVVLAVGACTLWPLGVSRRSLAFAIVAGSLVVLAVGIFGPPERFGYVTARLKAYVDPTQAPEAIRPDILALQSTRQSFLDHPMGKGSGKGVGYLKLSAPHNDYLLAVALEQHGWRAGVVMITGYMSLALGGIWVVLRTRDPFVRPIAAGCVTLLTMPMLLQVAVTFGVLPVTSAPMPLVTYGGTTTVTAWIETGALVRLALWTESEKSKRRMKDRRRSA